MHVKYSKKFLIFFILKLQDKINTQLNTGDVNLNIIQREGSSPLCLTKKTLMTKLKYIHTFKTRDEIVKSVLTISLTLHI